MADNYNNPRMFYLVMEKQGVYSIGMGGGVEVLRAFHLRNGFREVASGGFPYKFLDEGCEILGEICLQDSDESVLNELKKLDELK